MAVQSSGDDLAINADIVNEFGGTAPHALSEYYGGGDLVGAGANPNVPTSGEFQLRDLIFCNCGHISYCWFKHKQLRYCCESTGSWW